MNTCSVNFRVSFRFVCAVQTATRDNKRLDTLISNQECSSNRTGKSRIVAGPATVSSGVHSLPALL